MNNEIQRLHFEIKRINQRLENNQLRLQALEQLKRSIEAKQQAETAPKTPEPTPESSP